MGKSWPSDLAELGREAFKHSIERIKAKTTLIPANLYCLPSVYIGHLDGDLALHVSCGAAQQPTRHVPHSWQHRISQEFITEPQLCLVVFRILVLKFNSATSTPSNQAKWPRTHHFHHSFIHLMRKQTSCLLGSTRKALGQVNSVVHVIHCVQHS